MDAQTLSVFTQFVEFIKNVDNYEQVVEQIKAATAANADSLNNLTQGQGLAAYEASLDDKEQRLILERQEFDKSCRAQNDVLIQRAKDLDAKETNLATREALVKGGEMANQFATQAGQQKAADLDRREQDLNTRDAANNAVAADLAARLALIKQAGG